MSVRWGYTLERFNLRATMQTVHRPPVGAYAPPASQTATPPVRLWRDGPLVIIGLVLYAVIVVISVIGVTVGWLKHPHARS